MKDTSSIKMNVNIVSQCVIKGVPGSGDSYDTLQFIVHKINLTA